jgi:bacterioferritin-associated ferredoxin
MRPWAKTEEPAVYVCICHAISEREIEAVVADGAQDLEDLHAALGVGECCGKCIPHMRGLLRDPTVCANAQACEISGCQGEAAIPQPA